MLIAINPFKMIRPLYTDARIREYRGKKYFELPPHVYALADAAYSQMISYRENQCVIISGESGAGKTETSKIIMQYISGVSGKGQEVLKVKERMLGSNPGVCQKTCFLVLLLAKLTSRFSYLSCLSF